LEPLFLPGATNRPGWRYSPARYPRLERHMSVLISILITFLVVVLILWLVQRLPVEARIRQIIQIVVIVIGIISLLKYLAVF
jgi:hypothetical protein